MGPPKKRKAESPNGSSPGNDREDEERHIPPREPNESSAEYLLRCFSPQGHLLYEFRHFCGYCKEYFLNGFLYSNHFRSKSHVKNQAAYEKERKGANVRGIHSLARQWGRVEKQARKELQKYFEDLHKKLKVMTQWTWCNENISLEFCFRRMKVLPNLMNGAVQMFLINDLKVLVAEKDYGLVVRRQDPLLNFSPLLKMWMK